VATPVDNTFWHLKTFRYWNVVQYQVGYLELTVCVDKHFGLQDYVQTLLVHKVEVGDRSVFVCKTIGKDKKHHQSRIMQVRGNFMHKHKQKEKEKGGNFRIIILSLKPHLVAPLLSDRGGHHAIPLTRPINLYSGLCWIQVDIE